LWEKVNFSALTLPTVQSLRDGDEAAWMIVYEWLWPKALAVASNKLRFSTSTDAEDVASIALQHLVDHAEKVSATEDLLPLTLAITHNQTVQLIRYNKAEKRDVRATDSLGEFDVPAPSASLSELDLQELRTLIESLQKTLSPKAASVLGDFYLKGLTQREIAERNKLALNSVGVNITRSLQRIREVMRKNPTLMKEIQVAMRNTE
jgi:RNA polymerase sigma factor (sigma-70 family)